MAFMNLVDDYAGSGTEFNMIPLSLFDFHLLDQCNFVKFIHHIMFS